MLYRLCHPRSRARSSVRGAWLSSRSGLRSIRTSRPRASRRGLDAEENGRSRNIVQDCFKLMRERIEAMKEIWTKPKAEYHIEMVDFPELMARPKPAQKPHP